MGGSMLEQSYYKSEMLDHKPHHAPKYHSPTKHGFQDINKSKNRLSTENFYSIQSDTSTGGGVANNDYNKQLIQKLDIIKTSAGIKNIEDY